MNKIDNKATRWLARQAFFMSAISPTDFDFIDENPERADEVQEFVLWLADDYSSQVG